MPLILLFAVSLSKESTLFVHQSFPHECAFENTSFIFTFLVLGYCGRFNCKEYPTPDIRSSEGVMRSLQATAVMHLLFPPSSKVFSTENGFCRSLEHQTGKGWPFFHFLSTTCPLVTPRKLRLGETIVATIDASCEQVRRRLLQSCQDTLGTFSNAYISSFGVQRQMSTLYHRIKLETQTSSTEGTGSLWARH